MKLAAIYTIYNGLELLEGSIKQIYDEVDEIILVAQTISNKGEVSVEPLRMAKSLSKDFPKISYTLFTPNLAISTKANELNKHNLGLHHARNLNCSHFLILATDHYYKTNEFRRFKMVAMDFDATFTQMYTYYKKPTWQLTPIEDYFMPFICKIKDNTQFVTRQYHLVIDPSLKLNTMDNNYIFTEDEIMMHHFSMIRTDIQNKFDNAAASIRWTKEQIETYKNEYEQATLDSEISYFKGRKLKEVDNYFAV